MSAPSSSHPAAGSTLDSLLLSAIADAVGTPAYVYHGDQIRRAYRTIDDAFGEVPHAVHYALKANSSLAVARLLRAEGSAADANSMGEVEIALRAGYRPDHIVFTGVGKRREELERAVALELLAINVESSGELDRLHEIARAHGSIARVALRVNPNIDAQSHPHISTGLRDSKFGVPIDLAPAIFDEMTRRPHLRPIGVHVHIGSQITTLEPLVRAAESVLELATRLRRAGIGIEHIDFGGGLGISYDGAPSPTPAEYVVALAGLVRGTGFTAVIEPGRALVGAAGLLLTRVVDVKHFAGSRRFVVIDAGMTELMRPALYGAYHQVDAVLPRAGELVVGDLVGPICESTDIFARNRPLPPLEAGDLLVIRDVGAYGAAMGHTYLRRPLPPEVMVDGGEWRVTRRRQTLDDMLRLEE
ncbi:MAG: diaminopimelate decarboxylase [Acidobacteria bacterium]|nr:diaminopimelate decarboxylase [Acidobacteriota bacterium]